MIKICVKASVFISCTIFSLSSCTKDDNDLSAGNSTNGKTTAVFNSNLTYGTMTDQDGNTYKTITIGTQTWMAENLRTTIYNDGTAISNVTGDDSWAFLSTGAYCTYNDTTNVDMIATYGCLYNWHAVNTGKLAPKGWHVTTDEEWTILIEYLGGEDEAGGKLKENGITHWKSPNTGATNETGFTAIPGGYHNYHITFASIGNCGYWWTSEDAYLGYTVHTNINDKNGSIGKSLSNIQYGFSVRCIRDQ